MVLINLKEKFEKTALERSSHIAIRHKKEDNGEEISYEDLAARIGKLSVFLREEGVKKGDRVAIIMENRPEWPVAFFAVVSLCAVCVPVNPDSGIREIRNILNDSGCGFLFVSGTSSGIAGDISAGCPGVEKIVSVDSNEFSDALEKKNENPPERDIGTNDLACILYTSGTTDEPKGVMLSHGNLLANCDSLFSMGLVTPEDSLVSVLPLHHSYPLAVTMLLPLLYGGRIIYPASMRGEDLLEAMREGGATVFVAVPQIYFLFYQKIIESIKKIPFPFNFLVRGVADLLYKLRNKTGINLARYLFYNAHRKFGRSLRFFVSGGAKLDENVQKTFLKLGFTMLEGYGLTETSPVLTFNPISKPKSGSAGLPVKDVELKISEMNEEGIGEVVARGPNIMMGYYNRPDKTADTIRDGWFHTGDLGYRDEQGYLFLTGRMKEMIVLSSGKNICPEEIEEIYARDRLVTEVCVFDVPRGKGPGRATVLWAVVVPDIDFFREYGTSNVEMAIKERFMNIAKALPSYQRLMGFTITTDALPRTLLGKIKRFEVKERYASKVMEKGRPVAEKEMSEQDQKMMESAAGEKIFECLKKNTGKKDIAPGDFLELDLGIDSLGRIELASELEEIFGARIKDEVIGKAFTVRDLVEGVGSVVPEEGIAADQEKEKGTEYWKGILKTLPGKETLKKIELRPGFMDWMGCFIFTGLLKIYFKIGHNLKVEGVENLPSKGPYILYVNHASYYDGFIVGAALPISSVMDLFLVGFRIFFDVPIVRNLVRIGRIIPLDFSSHFLEAFRSCYYVLTNGKGLCFFPEGLRSADGEVMEFKRGFGILAKETGAKVVPLCINGAFEAWPRTAKFAKWLPIKVRIGKPLEPGEAEKRGYELGAEDPYHAICVAAREYMIKLKDGG